MKNYNHKANKKKLFQEYTNIISIVNFTTQDMLNVIEKSIDMEEAIEQFNKKKQMLDIIGHYSDTELRDLSIMKFEFEELSKALNPDSLQELKLHLKQLHSQIGSFLINITMNMNNLEEFIKDMEDIFSEEKINKLFTRSLK